MSKHGTPKHARPCPKFVGESTKVGLHSVRDILIGGFAIWLFDPVHGLMTVSHHSEAIVWMVSNVQI